MYNNKVLKKYINHIVNLNKLLHQFDYLGEHPFISKIINNKNKKNDIIFEIIKQYGGSDGSVKLKKLSYDDVLKLSEADLDNDLKIDIFEYRFDSTSSIDNFDLFMEQLEQYEFRIKAKIKMLIEKRNKIKLDISILPKEIEQIETDIKNKEAERKKLYFELYFEQEMSIRKKNKAAEDAKEKSDEKAKEAKKLKLKTKPDFEYIIRDPTLSSNFITFTLTSQQQIQHLFVRGDTSKYKENPISIDLKDIYVGKIDSDPFKISFLGLSKCISFGEEFNIYFLNKDKITFTPLYKNFIRFNDKKSNDWTKSGILTLPKFDETLPSYVSNLFLVKKKC
jgi:hypothetical protein